ncbi:MAG: T9SS type A sorting domain-containing protein, partial [Prolixibacteraceae bacterium]
VADLNESSVNDKLILENPHHLTLEYESKPREIVQEYGAEPYPKSAGGGWETNSEYYRDRVKVLSEYSEPRAINSEYPNYEYDYSVHDSVVMEIGRHKIGDSRDYIAKVRDTQAPVFVDANVSGELPGVTIGFWEGGNNVTPKNPSIGWPVVIDSSQYFEVTWSSELNSETGFQQVYHITYTATDKSIAKNSSTAIQEITVDKTTSAKPYSVKNEIIIYPNPARNLLYIDCPEVSKTEQLFFNVIDFNGRKVLQKQTFNKTLDVSQLKPGNYILKINSENKTFYKKFVKN